ncbi:hypothetical protein GCM10010980_04060 [Corynebacterium marinum]|nr:hypothetical protein GCM10010980_04060 [Corynebacterium marinum]
MSGAVSIHIASFWLAQIDDLDSQEKTVAHRNPLGVAWGRTAPGVSGALPQERAVTMDNRNADTLERR